MNYLQRTLCRAWWPGQQPLFFCCIEKRSIAIIGDRGGVKTEFLEYSKTIGISMWGACRIHSWICNIFLFSMRGFSNWTTSQWQHIAITILTIMAERVIICVEFLSMARLHGWNFIHDIENACGNRCWASMKGKIFLVCMSKRRKMLDLVSAVII